MSDSPKPGMVGLLNKKTKKVTYHFPVDLKEIAATNSGEFELVDDGSVEAARVVAEPLKLALASEPAIVVVGSGGVETVTEDQVKLEVKAAAEEAKAEAKAAEPAKPAPAPEKK